MDGDAELLPVLFMLQYGTYLLLVAHQHDFTFVLPCSAHRAKDNLFRCKVAAHSIDCDFHRIPPYTRIRKIR